MNENINIEQKQSLGNQGLQIGIQNNYNGMTPKDATELAMNLFFDNFPKLQKEAMEMVNKRVDEFLQTLAQKLEKRVNDLSPFGEPDMQYVLVEAQTNYARFANDELKERLSELIVNRLKHNNNMYLKVILDKAISTIHNLSSEQIDMLTLILITKHLHNHKIVDLESANHELKRLAELYSPCSINGYSLMNSLGCFEINLGSAEERISKEYSLDEKAVKEILPVKFNCVPADYGLSHIGLVIAILNLNSKQSYNLKLDEFISNV